MIYEKTIEEAIISLLKAQGYEFIDENYDWIIDRKIDEFINEKLLIKYLKKINIEANDEIVQKVIDSIKKIDSPSLFERNYNFHKMLTDGITIESKNFDINPLIKLIDFENPQNNIFQVGHQIKYKESNSTRIPDIVIYINGLPLIIMELKSFDEKAQNATLDDAYRQLGGNSEYDGYRYDIPTLFNYNSFLVISDGVNTKVGTLTSKINRFTEWKSIEGEKGYDDNCVNKLEIMIKGLFDKNRLIDIIYNSIFFITNKNDKPIKIMAQYHQYYGVKKAFESIINNIKPKGNGKAGLIWHTQGSGKSFSMVMLVRRLLIHKFLKVPTIVVLTDRIDLDNQLLQTFFSAKEYLKVEPISVDSREDLVGKLNKILQGGIIFTTILKFNKHKLPKNERENIIVMTDEAHRSHYGIYETIRYKKNDLSEKYEPIFKFGIEKYIRDALPNATFIGFTGTPISTKEKQTTDIFGDIIDAYDITQSINDGATVKLFYESRLAKVKLISEKINEIDEYYNKILNLNQSDSKSIELSKKEMSKINIILENDNLIKKLATDILTHYEQRKNFLNGKAMIICQTRKAAAKLYKEIIKQNSSYKAITILVATTTNKDNEELRKLFGTNEERKKLAIEFKKDKSKYKIAIVCDMWLTGFDVPDLDVMYFIKKLKSHSLMQAIARVNRIYPGKNGGLIVDYIGLNTFLKEALSQYTDRDRYNNPDDAQKEIYRLLKEKLDLLNKLFYIHNINKKEFNNNDSLVRFKTIQRGTEFILSSKEREEKFIKDWSMPLKQSFILCAGILSEAEKNDVIYYLAIRSYILKLYNRPEIISTSEMNNYVSSLLIDAIKGDEVKVLTRVNSDLFNPIDLLSKEKIEELKKHNTPHIFIQVIKKLLERAIHESRKNNYIKSQEYSERLRMIIEKYNDRDINFDPEITIVNLVNFAKEMVTEDINAKKIGIFGRERAFYDALVCEKSPKDLLSDETLKLIAKEIDGLAQEYASIDWSRKESTKAKMRTKIKECLNKYNYPPNYRDKAIENVIKQAEYILNQ